MPASVFMGGAWRVVDDATATAMIETDLARFDALERRSPTSGNVRAMGMVLDEAERIEAQLERGQSRPPARQEKDAAAQRALRACEAVLEVEGLTVTWDCGNEADCAGGYGHHEAVQPRVIHLNPAKIKTDADVILTTAHEAWHASKRIGGTAYTTAEERDAEDFARYIEKKVKA